jgi:hypothetical protein
MPQSFAALRGLVQSQQHFNITDRALVGAALSIFQAVVHTRSCSAISSRGSSLSC